ncbi:MAG: hypothetical protein DWQ44_11505 [Bacteroidetes bacterium]|nr:MAG: hypothetical protein DWQ33_09625 [Bacteroidota bacterium]REK05246.1 MAG: hypothetical protein DWQ39_08635 [Bacteroidota bacterium]REK32651.1 MAG: hypothetical protein DWQ44_11505 [Bacteroidota bacterium]REK48902.1 MAG: hypothetical protein DWQ48_08455 [Bacteroidota bacterium]
MKTECVRKVGIFKKHFSKVSLIQSHPVKMTLNLRFNICKLNIMNSQNQDPVRQIYHYSSRTKRVMMNSIIHNNAVKLRLNLKK